MHKGRIRQKYCIFEKIIGLNNLDFADCNIKQFVVTITEAI
jgi:hypothetical protein